MRPLRIAVSACFFHPDPNRNVFKGKTLLYFEESLVHWVERGGAVPVLVPTPAAKFSLRDFAETADGLVLQGGADLCPRSYGEEPLRPEWEGDAIRDAYEIALVRVFRELKKPIFGVCRGLQLINVAFGGTLYQDIPTMHPLERVHRDREIYDQLFHDVRLSGWLESSYGLAGGRVNSVHHQGIKSLGKGLVADAYSQEDDIIEGIRAVDGGSFVAGVQWHPEFIDPARRDLLDPELLFEKFAAEVRASDSFVA